VYLTASWCGGHLSRLGGPDMEFFAFGHDCCGSIKGYGVLEIWLRGRDSRGQGRGAGTRGLYRLPLLQR
jgi:hypothetical protein